MFDRVREITRELVGWRGLKLFIYLILGALSGCFGPPTMHYDIQEYNKQVVSSEQQMLLYNVGRLYSQQPPHFMMLASVSQSRMFSASAGFEWDNPATWKAGPFTLGAIENPTIQFVPVQGSDFAQRFESPVMDKFLYFFEDERWYARADDYRNLILLFGQSLNLKHGDSSHCPHGLYRNRRPEGTEASRPNRFYFDKFSECIDSIIGTSDLNFVQIDANHVIPTSTSAAPLATDVVTALAGGYKWISPSGTNGARQTSTASESSRVTEQTSSEGSTTTVSDKSASETSTSNEEPITKNAKKTTVSDKNTSGKSTSEEKPTARGGKTTISDKSSSANSSSRSSIDFALTNPIRIPAWLDYSPYYMPQQLTYGDEIVNDVWPVTQDYFYVELRNGADRATVERVCHSQANSAQYDSSNNIVCGYLKVGNLLQIMQRLARMTCPSTDPKEIEKRCQQSVFGIGPKVPSWADSWASFGYRTEEGREETQWVWVPAHDPKDELYLASQDREAFFNLYKLYQMSLVDTTKLVTGTPPITISK
jgi:hypothetical protein